MFGRLSLKIQTYLILKAANLKREWISPSCFSMLEGTHLWWKVFPKWDISKPSVAQPVTVELFHWRWYSWKKRQKLETRVPCCFWVTGRMCCDWQGTSLQSPRGPITDSGSLCSWFDKVQILNLFLLLFWFLTPSAQLLLPHPSFYLLMSVQPCHIYLKSPFFFPLPLSICQCPPGLGECWGGGCHTVGSEHKSHPDARSA